MQKLWEVMMSNGEEFELVDFIPLHVLVLGGNPSCCQYVSVHTSLNESNIRSAPRFREREEQAAEEQRKQELRQQAGWHCSKGLA